MATFDDFLVETGHVPSQASFNTNFELRETSTAEARSLGCEFDVLANAWVPAQCIDRETLTRYKERGTWTAYANQEGTELVDAEDIPEREQYYTTRWDHAVHCAFVWQKQHRGYLTGGLHMDAMSASYNHTVHCSEVFLSMAEADPKNLNEIVTRVEIGFSSCEVEA